ncbi:type II secretion system F family protein [Bifidobacterium xylocopae]|nr:type II secretion system F family protein [Bifidobacterium xylocopae]
MTTVLNALAALLTACAVDLLLRRPARSLAGLNPAAGDQDMPLTLLLEMLAVCVRQGASVPHALERIGSVVQADLGEPMAGVARLLNQGTDWYSAWAQACSHPRYGHRFRIMSDCLEPSWRHGISPLGRIETTIEQVDQAQRRRLDEASAALAVKILLPTGLCILPAFILIGVLPCIAAFAGGLSI